MIAYGPFRAQQPFQLATTKTAVSLSVWAGGGSTLGQACAMLQPGTIVALTNAAGTVLLGSFGLTAPSIPGWNKYALNVPVTLTQSVTYRVQIDPGVCETAIGIVPQEAVTQTGLLGLDPISGGLTAGATDYPFSNGAYRMPFRLDGVEHWALLAAKGADA
jgi:hypothetical protein